MSDILGLSLTHLAAGAIGGIVRVFTRPEQSWLRRSAGALAGAFASGFGTPVLAPVVAGWLGRHGVPAEAVAGICGFVLGLCGLSLVEGAIQLAERWKRDPKLPPFRE
jgi:MFS family permease